MKKMTIENILGTYELMLTTSRFNYYVNQNECDENGCCIMTDNEGKIVSDNYFAYSSLLDDLEMIIDGKLKYKYINDDFLEQAKEYFAD